MHSKSPTPAVYSWSIASSNYHTNFSTSRHTLTCLPTYRYKLVFTSIILFWLYVVGYEKCNDTFHYDNQQVEAQPIRLLLNSVTPFDQGECPPWCLSSLFQQPSDVTLSCLCQSGTDACAIVHIV